MRLRQQSWKISTSMSSGRKPCRRTDVNSSLLAPILRSCWIPRLKVPWPIYQMHFLRPSSWRILRTVGQPQKLRFRPSSWRILRTVEWLFNFSGFRHKKLQNYAAVKLHFLQLNVILSSLPLSPSLCNFRDPFSSVSSSCYSQHVQFCSSSLGHIASKHNSCFKATLAHYEWNELCNTFR